jgi:hypothetical protein
MAWPDGNEAPEVEIRLPGGRGRSYAAFSEPISISEDTTAKPKAA